MRTFLSHVILVVIATMACVQSYSWVNTNALTVTKARTSTALFAHHVNKKITKKMMKNRPKKHRPSDINRNSVLQDKCITKVENAPSEYTIISSEEYMKVRDEAIKFWETGDSSAAWLEITEEDMVPTFSSNRDPLSEGGVQKRPNLVKSGTN